MNSVRINTPNVCGESPDNQSVKTLRALAAEDVNGATNLSVTVDGVANTNFRRVQSEVFSVALPDNNVFDAPCKRGHLGDVPAGIYSPAVDDGFYVLLDGLPAGPHTLHFHSENQGGFVEDVTYNLTVVAVLTE